MQYSEKPAPVFPRIIIHGGAGNVTHDNLPPEAWNSYRVAMLDILRKANSELHKPGATALDVATYAVSLLENDGLFNAGHGAVFTTAGTHELEASVMVSSGYRKRGVGVMKVKKVKNPIKLAREMLIRGEMSNGGGAGNHNQLEGETCDRLAKEWGLELVRPSYFWVRRRWDEHRRGLGKSHDDDTYEKDKKLADIIGTPCVDDVLESGSIDFPSNGPTWDGKEYLPQGTVGAVVMDARGIICAATSTGGLTNKLPGRIGDTPTIGAGFWAEQWPVYDARPPDLQHKSSFFSLGNIFNDCLPMLSGYHELAQLTSRSPSDARVPNTRAVGMSGTGNGDSFLRINAARTTAAVAQLTSSHPFGIGVPLQDAVSSVAGPCGSLQQSAEDRWGKTGEGEGGIIGIDFDRAEGRGKVVFDFNCGGLYHAWIDDARKERFAIFRDDPDNVHA